MRRTPGLSECTHDHSRLAGQKLKNCYQRPKLTNSKDYKHCYIMNEFLRKCIVLLKVKKKLLMMIFTALL